MTLGDSSACAMLLALAMVLTAAGCGSKVGRSQPASSAPLKPTHPMPTSQEYAKLAAEIEEALERDVVRPWFPRCIDSANGGFYANWDRQWNRQPSGGKFIVFQSRMIWTASQIAMRRPQQRQEFAGYARHGLKFLADSMWDREHGGFFWGVDDQGRISKAFGTDKHLYGEAFALYALSACYEATGEKQALNLARQLFQWLETHSHDAQNGGYVEALSRDGKPILPQGPMTPDNARFAGGGFILGYKSMNAHIHMLEALCALHRVWKDPTVHARLGEMLAIVRDRIAVEPGCLNLWFTPDWRAVPDHDSLGHDVETAFLLLEAAEELGQGHDPKTLRMARMLVDHALDWGWDPANGGFYDKAYAFEKAFDKKKVWWSEVEALNSLLLMHEHFGAQTDRYWQAFLKQWQFVRTRMIDSEFGGLYEELDADGTAHKVNKGHIWKAAYHDGRSFMLASERLRRLAQAAPAH